MAEQENHRAKIFKPVVDKYSTTLKDPKSSFLQKLWASLMLATTLNMIDNGARGSH